MTESASHEDRRTPDVLRSLRLAAGLTRFDVAREAAVSVAYVQQLEAGLFPRRRGTPAFLSVLDVLGADEDDVRAEVGR